MSQSQPSKSKLVLRFILLIFVISVCYLITTGSAAALHFPSVTDVTAENSTNLTVTVEDEPINSGETIRTGNDPVVTINVTGELNVTELILRINGKTRENYVPNSTSISQTTTLRLGTGIHSLQVIAKTNTTHELTGTIIEDSTPPLILYSQPFETSESEQPAANYTVNQTNIVIAGKVRDINTVNEVTITHQYTRTDTTGSPIETTTHTVPVRNGTFRKSIELVPTIGQSKSNSDDNITRVGNNILRISATDPYRHERTDEFRMNTTDTSPPNLTIVDRKNIYNKSTVQLSFIATDTVGLRAVGQQLGTGNKTGVRYYFITSKPSEQPRRFAMTRNYSVTNDEQSITITALDVVGKSSNITITPEYESFVTPEIIINQSETRAINEESIFVRGKVSDGRTVRVQTEVKTMDGTLVDIETLYDGESTDNVAVATQHNSGGQFPVVLQIHAFDTSGAKHTNELIIERPPTPTASDIQGSVSTDTVSPEDSRNSVATRTTSNNRTMSSDRMTSQRSPAPTTRLSRQMTLDDVTRALVNIGSFAAVSALITITLYFIIRRIYQ